MTPLVYLAESLGAKVMAYADDTQLLFLWSRGEESVVAAQHCLSSVFQWLANAQLKCNEGKSEVLLFGSFLPDFRERLWPQDFPRPTFEGKAVKNLGVWFDDNLHFATHVKKLAGTCYGILKTLRKFLPLLPRSAKETVVRALVLSRLDYANSLLVGIPVHLVKKLQVVQNAAARLILGLSSRDSVRIHLRSLHWLPIASRLQFKMLTIAHRALYGLGPIYLQKRLIFYRPGRHLRSSDQLLMQSPRFRRQRLGGSSFVRMAALAWNALPLALRGTKDPLLFRKKLKTLLF